MTSLCPGTLFHSPGLNHHSTPTPPTDTPADIERKLKRVPFNGRDWPRESPVARVYDIGNTSTKMVLLNRRLKKSQLRGLSKNNGEISAPDPERHAPDEPTTNWHYHRKCTSSCSEPYKPKISLDLGWVNSSQRPPVTFDSGSHVNHRRHTSCRVSGESPVVGWNPPRRPHTSASMATEAELRSMGSMLNDPELTSGERRYLYSIARIYSTSQMKQLKKDQYSQLLLRELAKGYHSPYEYERYFNYLNSPRKTQFGKLDTYREERRAQSAPPPPLYSHPDASGRGTPGGETDRSESKKGHRMTASTRSLQMSYGSSRTSLASGRISQKSRGGKKGKLKSTTKAKQSPPSSAKKSTASEAEPATPKSPQPKQDEQEPVTAVAAANREDVTDDAKGDGTDRERYDEQDSSRENDERSTETPRKDTASPTEDESPRKGEEVAEVPVEQVVEVEQGSEGGDVERSEDKDERSSEGVGNNTNTSSSNPNNLLALIVSDAEKDDDTEKNEDTRSATEDSATPQEPGMAKRFSSTELADGYSPRVNKEGRTRPLSRAGRESAIRERENSDDDYDDTDEETDTPSKQQTSSESKDKQQDERSPADEKLDTGRTEDSQEQERGDEESTTIVEVEKRAGSPEEGDERADDNHETAGQRSLIIPVTPRQNGANGNGGKGTNGEVLDLSSESRNRDVDKIEY